MIELELKEQVSKLLDNPVLIGLIRDKRYEIDKNTYIELSGPLNFSLSYVNDRLVLTIQDIQPKVTAKRILRFQGRLETISIGKNDIIVGLKDLPDVTLSLI